MLVPAGTTSLTGLRVKFVDDSGLPLTGKVAADFPNVYYSTGTGTAAIQITLADLSLITSAYSSGGVKEDTGTSGIYRLDVPNAALATGGRAVQIFGDTTGKHVLCEPIHVGPRVDVDTLKTQTVTCSAGVTVGPFVGNATAALAADASGRITVAPAGFDPVIVYTDAGTGNTVNMRQAACLQLVAGMGVTTGFAAAGAATAAAPAVAATGTPGVVVTVNTDKVNRTAATVTPPA